MQKMKRTKHLANDTRSLDKISDSQVTRDLKIIEEIEGSADIAPLSISTDGTRVWARQKVETVSTILKLGDDTLCTVPLNVL